MKCPRDQNLLRKWRLDKIDAHICPQCSGLFVDLDQKGAPVLSRSKIENAERVRIPADEENPLFSPATGTAMIPFLYRGVEVDYCEKSKAVWFDPGEINQVSPQPVRKLNSKASLPKIGNSDNHVLNGILNGIDAGLTPGLDLLFDFVGGVFDAF